MASFKRLEENWVLSDGLGNEYTLDAPVTVDRALLLCGAVKEISREEDRLRSEWTFRRRWTYTVRFDAAESDERFLLEMQGICGAAEVSVNGRVLGGVSEDRPRIELSEAVGPGENELKLRFRLPCCDDLRDPLPKVGPETAPRLIPMSFVSDPSLRAEGDRLLLTAEYHAGGRYTARITVSDDGENERTEEFDYTVGVGRRETAFDVGLAGMTDVRAAVMRAGAAAFTLDEKLPRAGEGAGFGIAVRSLAAAKLYAEAGANALSAPEWIEKRFPQLAPVKNAAVYLPENALQKAASLDRSGVPFPPAGGLWSRMGADSLAFAAYRDLPQAVRESRFRQAYALRAAAEKARAEGRPFLVGASEPDIAPFSRSLFDEDGEARPAFYALRDAWKPMRIVMLPPSDTAGVNERIEIPVLLLSAETTYAVCSADIKAMTPDGRMLGAASYPTSACGRTEVCRFVFQSPAQAETVLLRAVLKTDGKEADVWEGILSMEGAELPQAKLRIVNGIAENVSDTACVGFSAGGFRNLLPGEKAVIPQGIHGCEGLNIDHLDII